MSLGSRNGCGANSHLYLSRSVPINQTNQESSSRPYCFQGYPHPCPIPVKCAIWHFPHNGAFQVAVEVVKIDHELHVSPQVPDLRI